MPQVINTNIASLNAQRNLSTSQSALSVSLQRLSSGLRINSAKDDAAGLAISERMTSQVRGLNQAVRNANDGISLAQTAESALGEIGNLLQRMRELSIQSANATNSDSDRVSLQQEVSQLKAELTRIAGTTTFNGQKVLNGALQNIQFQVGAEANQTIGITIGDARSASIGSRLVTTNNTSNGLQTATNFSRYATAGASVGYAQAIAADIATAATNGYGAQTLTIKDASGTVLQGGLIKVNANDQASTIAARLNAVDGGAVRAEGYTSLKLANLSSQSGGNDAITLNLQSGTTLSTFTLTGVDTSSSQANLFAAIQNAVNGDADLKAAGVVAGIDGANNLVIRNNTGADIAIDLAIASGTVTVDAYGSDTGNTHVQLAAAGNGATRVGGQLSIFLANGYTVESDAAADYLFDAATNASVVAAETNVGIGTVTTQDTRSNLVGSYGYAVGKANASTGAATNGYGAQILRIRDAAGSLVSGGSINVAVSSEANTIAGLLNAVSGVNTTASTKATLSSWAETGGASGTVAYALDQTTVVAAKSWNGYTESQAFEEIRDAINNNSTLTGTGYAAALDATGNLVITNSEGRNIELAITQSSASAGTSFTAVGDDLAATAVTINATSDNFTVGGRLAVSLPEGYTIESSVAGNAAAALGLFNSGVSAQVKTVVNNVSYGNSVAAQTLTVNGTASASVAIAKDDSAATIAQKLNTISATTGVTAEARSQAKLSDVSAAGTISFTLNGTAISGSVTGSSTLADLSDLASSINAKSDLTGVSARLTDSNAAMILESATGANIVIADFTHSAGTAPTSANIGGTSASIKVAGIAQAVNATTGTLSTTNTTATTLYYGGLANRGADSTVVGGTVFFRSSGNFDVRSSASGTAASLLGGNSSLFSTDAGIANASALSNINGVDVSTVDGANAAVSVIDYALTQVNNVRGALGAVQNRFESTIASLSAGAENLSAARSRVRDADFAQETANLTRSQILQQAGIAMLAQANQLPQLVLSLLK